MDVQDSAIGAEDHVNCILRDIRRQVANIEFTSTMTSFAALADINSFSLKRHPVIPMRAWTAVIPTTTAAVKASIKTWSFTSAARGALATDAVETIVRSVII